MLRRKLFVIVAVLTVLTLAGCTETRPISNNASGDDDSGTHSGDTGSTSDTGVSTDTDSNGDDTNTATDTGRDSSTDDTSRPHDTSNGDDTSGGGTIEIYFKGDLSQKQFNDGLSGQTPKEYEIALSKYHIQTSLNDSSPEVCFEHADPTVADMLEDNLVGTCDTQSIPTDYYTHGRTQVDWVRITVEGTLHYQGQGWSGEFTFFRAYSDTNYGGRRFEAGQGWIEYSGVTDYRISYDYGTDVPTGPGFEAEMINGEFWLTFPYNRPLPVNQQNQQAHWSRLHWEIYEGFRWRDRDLLNYTDGVWDVSSSNSNRNEEDSSYGVTGYHVTTSIDP